MMVHAIDGRTEFLPLAMLDETEVDAVSAGFGLAGAVGGAFVSGATYVGQATTSGTGSWIGFGGAIVGGAAAGFFLGPTSMAGGISGSFVGFYAGSAGGLFERWNANFFAN